MLWNLFPLLSSAEHKFSFCLLPFSILWGQISTRANQDLWYWTVLLTPSVMCSDTVLRICFFGGGGAWGKESYGLKQMRRKAKTGTTNSNTQGQNWNSLYKKEIMWRPVLLYFGTSIYKQDLVQWAPLFLGISTPLVILNKALQTSPGTWMTVFIWFTIDTKKV